MERYTYDAVVLAGGAARRLGGEDKPALVVGGMSLLDRVLAVCADASATIVVGPERATARGVRWVREDPPGGGPVAGLAAGLAQVSAEVTLLLAADLPFLDAPTVHRLLDALGDPGIDAAVLVDEDGREQLLTAAYRTRALRAALTAAGNPDGARLRAVTGGLRTRRLPDTAAAAVDCDTWDDVERARKRAGNDADTRVTPP